MGGRFAHGVIAAFVSPGGVFVLGALDSTLFFSLPFGIDTAVVVLAARLNGLAWTVPLKNAQWPRRPTFFACATRRFPAVAM